MYSPGGMQMQLNASSRGHCLVPRAPRAPLRAPRCAILPPVKSYTRQNRTVVKAEEASSSAPTQEEVKTEAPSDDDDVPEEVFYEGNGGCNAELALSLVLGVTLIYAPLTMASIGRRLWLSYRFTNKRLIVKNTSPLIKNEVQIPYSKIKEIRTAPRAFGMWGDMVIFLNDGARLEIAAMDKYQEVKEHIERCKWTL